MLRAVVTVGATLTLLVSSVSCLGSVSVNKSAPPPQAGSAEGLPTPHAGPTGTVEVVEVQDGDPDENVRWAQVDLTYRNDTDRTFQTVQVWCRAYDASGWAIGAQSWSLVSSMLGPLEPGFRTRGTVRIRVEQPGVAVDRVECRITDAYAAGG